MAHSEKHREGAQHAQLIEAVSKSVEKNRITNEEKEILNKAIRFYGSNITQLPECNQAVFKLAEIFFKTDAGQLIQWNFRDSNALLLLMVTMLLKRKDEGIIRAAAIIVAKLIGRLTEAELSRSVEIHQKPAQLVFHKMSKVATYYTQYKLLEVLHVFLHDQDEVIGKIFKKEKVVVDSGSIQDATHFFESLESDNFEMTARDFLDSYNQTMCNPSFIHSHQGYVVAVDEAKKLPITKVFFDFCLRNLSISFFIKASVLTGDQRLENERYFVELEDCEITVDPKRFQNPNHVQLIVKSSRYQVLDKLDNAKSCQMTGFVKMIIHNDDELILGEIVPRYQSKSPMLYDNNTDMESMASFRTVNTVIPHERPVETPPVATPVIELSTSLDSVAQNSKKTAAPLKLLPQLSVEEIFKARTSEKPLAVEPVKRQHTQIAKVGPLTAKQARGEIFDTIQDDNDDLPTFSRFMTQARERRQGSQTQEASQEPVEEEIPRGRQKKKSPAKKRARAPAKKPAAKKAASKSKKNAEESSDIDAEVEEQFKDALHPSEPLAPVKKEPKQPKNSRSRSVVMNSSAEDREIMKSLPKARQQKKRSYFTAKQKPATTSKARTSTATKTRQPAATKTAPAAQPAQRPRPELDYSSDDVINMEQIREEQTVEPPVKLIKTTRPQVTKAETPTSVSKVQKPAAQTRVPVRKPAMFNILRKQNNDLRPPAPEPAEVDLPEPEVSVASNIRRPFEEISHLEILNEQRPKRQRPDGEENQAPVAKKPRDDFDKIVNEGRKSEKIPQKTEKLPQKTETLDARRRKRVSFDNDVTIIHKKTPPKKRVKVTETSIVRKPEMTVVKKPEIPLEVGPKVPLESVPETMEPAIKYNTAMLNDPLLNEFINGSQKHSSSFEDDFDELIMTTQTIQKKKLSPTIVRTVQYRQFNESKAEQPTTSRRSAPTGRASAMFMQKAQQEVENTIKELQKLQDPVQKSLKPTTKASIINAAGVVRSTHDRLKNHVAEHVKLLKRLHHSKRTMTQLFDENHENIKAWRDTIKQGILEMQQLYNERVQQVEAVHQNMIAKQETLKKEVWREYLADITNQFKAVVERHQEF